MQLGLNTQNEDAFLDQLQMLMEAAYDGREDEMRGLVASVVPTYHPAGEHGSEDKGKAYEEQMKAVEENSGK